MTKAPALIKNAAVADLCVLLLWRGWPALIAGGSFYKYCHSIVPPVVEQLRHTLALYAEGLAGSQRTSLTAEGLDRGIASLWKKLSPPGRMVLVPLLHLN